MPITYSIDSESRWLIVIATDLITYTEIVAHLEQERDDGLLTNFELIDGREARLNLTPDEVRRIVELLRQLGRKSALGPTAVLVNGEYSYGMMRMLEILVEDVCDVRPFRDRREAEAWLQSIE